MMKLLWNRLGQQATHAVVGGHLQGSRLNMKLGFAMLRDRRVPAWPKLLSLVLGGGIAAALVAFEIPVEAIIAAILPALGFAIDAIADGMEVLVLSFLFAGLLLPFLAPRTLVDQIMAERAGSSLPVLPPSVTQ